MTKTPSDTPSNSQGFKPPAGGRLIWTLLILMAGGGLFIAHQQRQQQLQFQSLTEQMAVLQRSQAEQSVRIEQRLVAVEGRVAKLESTRPPDCCSLLPELVARVGKLEAEQSRITEQELAELKKKQKQVGEQLAGLDTGLKAAAAERESTSKTLLIIKSQIAQLIKISKLAQ